MLTLKIIGLAFEAHQAFVLKNKKDDNEETFDVNQYNFDLTFLDIFHYIFNYCGVLTGIFLIFLD